MPDSPNIGFAYLEAAQSQKHVTVNEALALLDAFAPLSLKSATIASPPGAPAEGDCYLLPASSSGGWQGKDGKLAIWTNGGWTFIAPKNGWLFHAAGTGKIFTYDGKAWGAAGLVLDRLGINSEDAGTANRLFVKAAGATFSHPGSGGHQLSINKAADTDTASILFKTAFSGKAELGLMGSDSLAVKTHNGTSWIEALRIASNGQVTFPSDSARLLPRNGTANTVLSLSQGGAPVWVEPSSLLSSQTPEATSLTPSTRPAADGQAPACANLVRNGRGEAGDKQNFPALAWSTEQVREGIGAFRFRGHYSAPIFSDDTIALTPDTVYRCSASIMTEDIAGAFKGDHGNRHQFMLGLAQIDADGKRIESRHWHRFSGDGVDSRTTLTRPLSPGDREIHVADARGWNGTDPAPARRGIIILGWRDKRGRPYLSYSRLVEADLFALGGVDRKANKIRLSKPFPSALANPRHSAGTWEIGTAIANSDAGEDFLDWDGPAPLAKANRWFRSTGYLGGIDLSGLSRERNFCEAAAGFRVALRLNFSNRPGGWKSFPDTSGKHRVWIESISVMPAHDARLEKNVSGGLAKGWRIRVPAPVSPTDPSLRLVEATTVRERI